MNSVSADIVIESALWDAEPQAEATVAAAITVAAKYLADLHSTRGGEVSILLADDSAVREINQQWRGLDKPTNVLSFPAADTPATKGQLGDIVIAYETLRRECDDEGRLFVHHLAHLTVHGFLHLIGYDHETDAQADEMESLESRIMAAMNMPDPWADTGADTGADTSAGSRELQHGRA